MARITIEDCLKHIPNRFQLSLAATYRARQLLQGHTPKVDAKDKPTVIALRDSHTRDGFVRPAGRDDARLVWPACEETVHRVRDRQRGSDRQDAHGPHCDHDHGGIEAGKQE